MDLIAPAMTIVPTVVETPLATLRCTRPDLLEIEYRPGVVFTPHEVAQVQAARRQMMGERHYATFSVIPGDADFTLATLQEDHSAADRGKGKVLASAILVHSAMIQRLTHVYFKHHPQLQHLLITDNEAEARAWIEEQLRTASPTGS